MALNYFLLSLAAIFPVLFAIGIYFLDKKTRLKNWGYWERQIIIGLIFGGIAISGTHFGIQFNGAAANVRDASVIISGLCFGSPAGLIAGTIAALERLIVGLIPSLNLSFTVVACTVSTFIAGVSSALLRKYMFNNKRAGVLAGAALAGIIETFHLFMVFVTRMDDYEKAYAVINACTVPMLVANTAAVFLCLLILQIFDKGKDAFKLINTKTLNTKIQFYLGTLVTVTFVLTSVFMFFFEKSMNAKLVRDNKISIEQADLLTNIHLYVNTFLEIISFGIIFILMYLVIRRLVTYNLRKTNIALDKITRGQLNTIVQSNDVRDFKELADGINTTVAALKKYIKDANERIDKELAFAKSIQLNALPSIFPPFPEIKQFDIYAKIKTAKEVGGDFYDFYFSNLEIFNFLIADVSGKGIPAALFMMRAKQVLKSTTESQIPVNEVFTKGNSNLCDGNDAGMFVTAWQGSINLKNGTLKFANGGHNPPLIKHASGKFEYLKSKSGLVLGAFPTVNYPSNELKLNKGDIIFLYTDGVTEALNTKTEQFGETRLLETLNSRDGLSCKEMCDLVLKDLEKFTNAADQFDDITMLAFKYNGN